MLIISKAIAPWCKMHADGDHDDIGGDGTYDYNAPAAPSTVPDGDDDDGDYDYAPAASMEGDDDDGDYDYAPAA
ncbi:hypothetical protein CIPAW_04G168300 [Carya illinoinensis]|uniref:Uncharacterized protein n=1 Tax=Carya illinoinensis TaxID=32201 RepID=A0A8T1QX79_CARIL|nr:hypothetical protein CIPAW_04G168300 [Carya illinoinensis]